ncbi:MAG: hypothetical protein GY953_50840 [bacterium]|nr:hypothetical protein [bacterium]
MAIAAAFGIPYASAEPAPSSYPAERPGVVKPGKTGEIQSWEAERAPRVLPAEAPISQRPRESERPILPEWSGALLPAIVPFALRQRPPPVSS